MKVRSLCLLMLVLSSIHVYSQSLSAEEQKLYDLIMRYRKEKGLPLIPLSESLTIVAQTHVRDLMMNQPDEEACNMHSWSNKGKWTSCCYTNDHAKARCMWSKPRELTPYTGDGYEIAYWNSGNADSESALISWQKSTGHNSVIINSSIWKGKTWRAIGIGIYQNYAVVWFGEEEER